MCTQRGPDKGTGIRGRDWLPQGTYSGDPFLRGTHTVTTPMGRPLAVAGGRMPLLGFKIKTKDDSAK